MSKAENIKRLAEVEQCLAYYFQIHVTPVMEREYRALRNALAKEIADYSLSAQGIVRSMAASLNYTPDDTVNFLRMQGKECSKTDEEYVEKCTSELKKDKDMQADLSRMADEWRNAVVAEVGRERYDELSRKLGADLALAYVDYRMEQQMIDKMVRQRMPKSSFEYILRKGTEGSLFGLQQAVLQSPLEKEIEARGEAAYHPSGKEKAAAKGLSIATDAAAMGGVYSWAALTKFAAIDVAFSGLETILDKKERESEKESLTVEQCISQALFGTTENRMAEIRQEAIHIKSYESESLQTLYQSLSKPMNFPTEEPEWMKMSYTNPFVPSTGDNDEGRETVMNECKEKETREGREEKTRGEVAVATVPSESPKQERAVPTETAQSQASNLEGWSSLMQSVGLDGMTDIGRNLSYVIATLPDMLVGLFTGKTQSVGLKSELIPLASILIGLFIKNPLLKLALIGMGGANLLNKMGHEAIERQEAQLPKQPQYKQYADEPLNPRITEAVMKGNTLITTIDGIPCSITISGHAAAAYAAGALPLNTLANAVLVQYDRQREAMQGNRREVEMENGEERNRGVVIR